MASTIDKQILQYLQGLNAGNPAGLPGARPPALTPTGPGLPGGLPGLPGSAPGGLPGALPVAPPPPLGSAGSSTLSVAIDRLPFKYQLTEADVKETFGRWGSLQSVQIISTGFRDVAVVNFTDPMEASSAQMQLNRYTCSFDGGVQGTLVVVFGPPEQLQGPTLPGAGLLPGAPGVSPTAPPPLAGAGALGAPPPCAATAPTGPLASGPGCVVSKSSPAPLQTNPQQPLQQQVEDGLQGKAGLQEPQGQPSPPTGGPAANPAPPQNPANWLCKVGVKAQLLQSEFPLVQKIVGQDGANMQHLREHFGCHVILRGQGSGTREPDTGLESAEPLFLEMRCADAAKGTTALEMVKDLLQCVYDEHKTFCLEKGFRDPGPLMPDIVIPA